MKQTISEIRTYFIEAVGTDRIKIGQSTDVSRRFAAIKCTSPIRLKLLGSTIIYTEENLHKRFNHLRCNGEWFRATKNLRQFIESLVNPNYHVKRAAYFKVIDDVLARVHALDPAKKGKQ